MSSPSFNPQYLEVKETGRIELAKKAGLSLKVAAKYFTTATHKNFQSKFNSFTAQFPEEAKVISDCRANGVGPGEMVAYFLFDNIHLGGSNSHTDLWSSGKEFAEVKGGRYVKSSHTITGFKITKDGDPAVHQLLKELRYFNDTYRQITGANLPDWEDGSVKTSSLEMYDSINLSSLARKYKGISRVPIMISSNVGERSFKTADGKVLAYYGDPDGLKKLEEFSLQPHQVPVNRKLSTVNKIITRWGELAHANYLEGKKVALIDESMRMVFFGNITKEMIGLYCVHRNQPWARIYLP